MPNRFICPYPLVYADHTEEYPKNYITHWAYELGNCAVRCPTIVLTENEFNDFNNTVWYVSIVSFTLSVIVLLFHLTEAARYSLRIYFIIGFMTGSFAFVAFPPLNHNLRLICSEDRAHYIEQNPICVSQSTFLVFSFSWIAIWGAIYAFDIYLVTLLTFDQLQLKRLRKRYPWFALVLTVSITSIGLFADNFGYDYTIPLPNCLYLFSANDIYFWTTLVIPYGLSILLCFLASVGTIYRLQSVFVSGRRTNRQRLIQSVMNSFNIKNSSLSEPKQRNVAVTSVGSNSNSTATKISSPAPGSENDINDNNNNNNNNNFEGYDEDDFSQSIDFSKKWSVDGERYPHHIDSVASEPPDLFGRTASDPNYNQLDQPNFGLVTFPSTSPDNTISSPLSSPTNITNNNNNNVNNNNNDEDAPITIKPSFQHGQQLETVVENPMTRDSSIEIIPQTNSTNNITTSTTTPTAPPPTTTTPTTNSNNNTNKSNNYLNSVYIPITRTISSTTNNTNNSLSITERTKSKAPSNYISTPSEVSRMSFNIGLSETEENRPTRNSVPDDDFMLSISSNDYFIEMQDSSVSTSMRYQSNLPTGPQPSKSGVYSVNSLQTSQTMSYNDQEQQYQQQQQQQQESYTLFNTISSKLSGTWKYNGRVIIFISVYCAISVYILPVLVYLFHTTYNENVDSAEEFIGCLIGASFRAPNQTQEEVDNFARHECGSFPDPRPPFALMVSVCYWGAGFGIIPAIIFGSIFFEKIQNWFRKTFPKSLNAPLLR